MPDSLSPVTMTEDYYAKIAGQDVTPPDPATREQKWLDAIAERVDGLAEGVEDLGDIVPTPAADDSGKVLTAGADGTASWQTASGGGDALVLIGAGTAIYDDVNVTIFIDTDKTYSEVVACFAPSTVKPVYVLVPALDPLNSPYYDYTDPSQNYMLRVENIGAPTTDYAGMLSVFIYNNDGVTQLAFEMHPDS